MSEINHLNEILVLALESAVPVQVEALKILGGVCGSMQVSQLQEALLVQKLKKLIVGNEAVSHAACVVLINISAEHATFRKDMIKHNVIQVIMEYLLDSKTTVKESQLMLLSNLSSEKEGSAVLMQEGTELEGLYMMRLLDMFVKDQGSKQNDPCQFIANIFVNISQVPTGRAFLLHEKRNVLSNLIPFIQSSNVIRKLGILKTIRNCCYERTRISYLATLSLGLIEAVVVPLIGPDPIPNIKLDKVIPGILVKIPGNRDSLLEVRTLCVEIIQFLVTDKATRIYMKGIEIYPFLRELHKVETDAAIVGLIEDCVQFLLLDESTEDQEEIPSSLPITNPNNSSSLYVPQKPVQLPAGLRPEHPIFIPKPLSRDIILENNDEESLADQKISNLLDD